MKSAKRLIGQLRKRTQEKESDIYFIGYHGTSENSALSILSEGIQARYLPPTGQIGRGFYVARSNGPLPQWAATQATAPAQRKISYFTRLISLLTGEANNPFIDRYARRTVLKIYATRPLLHCKWNIMNPGNLHVLKMVRYDNGNPGLDLINDMQWLQMVVPPEELQYLRAKQNDGIFEQPHNWHAKENSF